MKWIDIKYKSVGAVSPLYEKKTHTYSSYFSTKYSKSVCFIIQWDRQWWWKSLNNKARGDQSMFCSYSKLWLWFCKYVWTDTG